MVHEARSIPVRRTNPVGPILFVLLVLGLTLLALPRATYAGETAGAGVPDSAEPSRWPNPYADGRTQLRGALGLFVFSREGLVDTPPSNELQSDTSPDPYFGLIFMYGFHEPLRDVGERIYHEVELYWDLRFNFLLPAFTARATSDWSATWRIGSDSLYGVLGSVAGGAFFSALDSADTGIGEYYTRLMLGVGTRSESRADLFVEFGVLFVHLFQWDSWTIGAELRLGIGQERLRITYIPVFGPTTSFGPHPFVQIAYEWRIFGI